MRSFVVRISSLPIWKLAIGAIHVLTIRRPIPQVAPPEITSGPSIFTPARFAASSVIIDVDAPVSNSARMRTPLT